MAIKDNISYKVLEQVLACRAGGAQRGGQPPAPRRHPSRAIPPWGKWVPRLGTPPALPRAEVRVNALKLLLWVVVVVVVVLMVLLGAAGPGLAGPNEGD